MDVVLTEKDIKKFNKLLINTRAVYWNIFYDKNFDFIGRITESLNREKGKQKIWLEELLAMVLGCGMTNEDIQNHMNTMVNPRAEWNKRMKEHNNGGKETRDNKGQFVEETTTYQKPNRFENGNIEHCNFNKIRYPKKKRSKRTWRQFYKMFPKQAIIDNFDGNTSSKMK